MIRRLFDRVADWAVPATAVMSIGFVPGCSCITCAPGCPLPALTYLIGAAA